MHKIKALGSISTIRGDYDYFAVLKGLKYFFNSSNTALDQFVLRKHQVVILLRFWTLVVLMGS